MEVEGERRMEVAAVWRREAGRRVGEGQPGRVLGTVMLRSLYKCLGKWN